MRVYIVSKCTDVNGRVRMRRLTEFDKNVKGGYSISSAYSVDLTKTGSASGFRGIPGRTREQIPSGVDPNDVVGVFYALDEIMHLLKSDEEMRQIVESICEILPLTHSYIPFIICSLFSCLAWEQNFKSSKSSFTHLITSCYQRIAAVTNALSTHFDLPLSP